MNHPTHCRCSSCSMPAGLTTSDGLTRARYKITSWNPATQELRDVPHLTMLNEAQAYEDLKRMRARSFQSLDGVELDYAMTPEGDCPDCGNPACEFCGINAPGEPF